MTFTIRKFYDTAIAETSGGAETEVAEQPSIAALMAQHGVKNGSNEMVAKPINITPQKEQTETKEENAVAPVETTTPTATETKVEEPPIVLETKAEPTKIETPKTSEQPVVEVQTWQSQIKNEQPDTVLKELGFDDNLVNFIKDSKELDPKMVAFLDSWKKGEDVTKYLREMTTDYSKMSAEDVMRHQLRQDYPKASEAALNALYKKEVVEAYNLDSEDETEKEEGLLLLEAKAEKFRDSFAESQQNYLLPKAPEPKPKTEPAPDPQAEQRKVWADSAIKTITESSYTKDIFATGKFTIGEGEDKFTFPVDPKELLSLALDKEDLGLMFDIEQDSKGKVTNVTPKTEHQLLVAAITKYGMPFLKAFAEHHEGLGSKKLVKSIDNAKEPENNTGSQSTAQPKSIAEAMAKTGQLV